MKFNERMVDIAVTVSTWSHCPQGRQHGCVLAVDGRFIISTGYNGPPRGSPYCDCDGKPKEYCLSSCRAIHAEINAIANAAMLGISTNGVAAYVTKVPCKFCWGALSNAGVEQVWAPVLKFLPIASQVEPITEWQPVKYEDCDPWPRS